MTARLNISIPDGLNERLAAYKSRIQLSISAICQEALEAHIQMLEAEDAIEDSTEKVLTRWSGQLAMTKGRWYQEGLKDSADLLKEMNYEDALAVERARDENDYSDVEWLTDTVDESECPPALKNKYRDGLIDGILKTLEAFHAKELDV